MTIAIRRLGAHDVGVLTLLTNEDADFDLDGRDEGLEPLLPEAATRFLENPSVLHWVAFDGANPVGHLYCTIVPLRSSAGRELLLYEIGVRSAFRRRGIGRALLDVMEAWMKHEQIAEVWVLADNSIAVDFYRGCGMKIEPEQPVYMTKDVS